MAAKDTPVVPRVMVDTTVKTRVLYSEEDIFNILIAHARALGHVGVADINIEISGNGLLRHVEVSFTNTTHGAL